MNILPPAAKQRLVKWLSDQLPTLRRTIFNVRTMQSEIAPGLDVDRVHAIIGDAQGGNVDDLFRLYRDMMMTGSHLQGRFVERKEAVTSDTLSIQPVDKENPDDVMAAAVVQAVIDGCPDWEKSCAHLLDSILWPVSLVEKTFKPSARIVKVKDGESVSLSYDLSELTVVPYELLVFSAGRLQIRQTDELGNPLSVYEDPDSGRYIIHRGHLLTSVPDNWGGPMRSIVFWWLLGHMGRDWWARYLDRYGAPWVIAKYDQGDDQSRSILQSALQYCTRVGGLVVSSETSVEFAQAQNAGASDAFDLFRNACNQEISNLICGQSLSSNAKSTGLGSGVAGLQSNIRDDKRRSDARRLAAALRSQLFEQIVRINGLVGQAPKAVFGSDDVRESAATGDLLVSLKQASLEPDDSALPVISEKVGFQIRRTAAPDPALAGPAMFGTHSVSRFAPTKADEANAAICREAAAQLAPTMRRRYAPVLQLIATSRSPADALGRIEAYCSKLDPLESAEITEAALKAMAANGAALHAR